MRRTTMVRHPGRSLAAAGLLLVAGLLLRPSPRAAAVPSTLQPDAVALTSFWSDQGGQEGAMFGSSVASGDLDGDGYADIIVGAPSYDIDPSGLGVADNGRVFVYLGSSIDPPGSPSYVLDDAERGYIRFGTAVASGGDFFHGGHDDLLVGVPNYFRSVFDPVPGYGRVYLYRGTSRTPAWTGVGTSADQAYGSAVAFVGDTNGDGYDDILVGDPLYSGDHTHEGRVFLYRGNRAGPGEQADQILTGGADDLSFGLSISAAGDVNHDGYADVLIGAPGTVLSSDPGSVFLYLGSRGGLSLAPGWNGTEVGLSNAGRGVASAGDVNGDGNPDVLVAGQWFGTPRVVLFLGNGTGLEGSAAWSVEGGRFGVGFLAPLMASGDFNMDGDDDVAIGTPAAEGSAGKVSVYLGSPGGLNTLPGWEATGASTGEILGDAVAVGDFDGNGLAEVVAGAPGAGTVLPQEGAAFAYRVPGGPVLDLLDPMCDTATDCNGPYLLKQQNGQVVINPTPAVLATASVRRTTAATDGVTRLLLRQKSDAPVTLRLVGAQGLPLDSSWGTLRSLDGFSVGDTIVVQPQDAGGESYVFAEYRTPENFPGTPGEFKLGVVVFIEADSPQGIVRPPLVLKPPPIVLVHGMWSDSFIWKSPTGSGGLDARLRAQGYVVCPDCRVDYRGRHSAASFDPWADTAEDQFAVRALIAATESAREWMRAHDTAVTQVDVVAHSLGALMTRSRVVYRQWPYSRFLNYGRGDFHKLISIGAPHRGSPIAGTLLAYRSRPFLGTTLQGFFEVLRKPFGHGLYELQPGSEALRRIGVDSPVQVRLHPIVGIEPAHTHGCTESCTEDTYNWILRHVHCQGDQEEEKETVDFIFGGEGTHDTLVPAFSQRGGVLTSTPDVPDVVHARVSLFGGDDIGEVASTAIWDKVETLLQAPLSEFHTPSVYTSAAPGVQEKPCPPASARRAAVPATSATVTLLPTPGTIVQPGDMIKVRFEIQGGNLVEGAGFAVGGEFHTIDGASPFSFSFRAPADRLGELPIDAGTVGPGPENYSASTFVIVSAPQPPVSISVSPAHLDFFLAGELQGLTVLGTNADGSEVDLSSPSSGTAYAVGSGGTNVVAVSPEGVVQALGAGEDEIVVSSSGHVLQVPVRVTLDNLPPIVTAPASVTVEEGSMLQVPFSATDPEGDPMTLGVDGLPRFATFTDLGGGAGRLDLLPQSGDLGTYTVLLVATDEGTPPFGGTARLTLSVVPCQQSLPGPPTLTLEGTTLSWTADANSRAYDIVEGLVGDLTASGGDFSVSTLACVANDRTDTTLNFTETPAPGAALWLLVRGVGCAGNGSYDAPAPNAQAGSRDAGIAASPVHCP